MDQLRHLIRSKTEETSDSQGKVAINIDGQTYLMNMESNYFYEQ